MYVWQMNDGRWHISLMTSQRDRLGAILANKPAFALFDRGCETEREAREAEQQIRALMLECAD